MSRRTLTAALAAGLAGLLLAACSSSSTGATSATFPDGLPKPTTTTSPPPPPPVHVAACATKPTIQVIDTEKFQDWNATCAGKSALATWSAFVATVNDVWANPFQNNLSLAANLAAMAAPKSSTVMHLPPGCHLNPKGGTLPAACKVLEQSTTSPFAAELALLEQVATPQAAQSIVSLQLAAIDHDEMPTGSLGSTAGAVVRSAVATGQPASWFAPALSGSSSLPHFDPAAAPTTSFPCSPFEWPPQGTKSAGHYGLKSPTIRPEHPLPSNHTPIASFIGLISH